MALTMKLGPLPMYVFAPMNTEPQLMACKTGGFCISEPIVFGPAASVAKAMYVGALSRKEDRPPDNQKNCQGFVMPRLRPCKLNRARAGTMVTKMPANTMATSTMADQL